MPTSSGGRSRLIGLFVAMGVAFCLVCVSYYVYQTSEQGDSSRNQNSGTARQTAWYGDSLDQWQVVATVDRLEIVTSFAMSADGRYLAYVHGPSSNPNKPTRAEHGLHLANVDGTETRLQVVSASEFPRIIEFSPDGSTLAAGNNSGRIAIWKVETGALVSINEEKREGIGSLAFTNDGRTIYCGCFRGEVWKFGPDLQGELFFKTGEDWMQGSLVALRDEERELVVVGSYFKIVARAVHTSEGQLVRTFDRGARGIQFLSLEADLSADGRFLITCKSREADIWDATSATFLRTIADKDDGTGTGMECATFSPDTRRVLFVGFSGIQLWDHVGGKKIWDLEYQLLPDASSYRAKPRFTSDGRRFAVVRPNSNGRSNEIAVFEFHQ